MALTVVLNRDKFSYNPIRTYKIEKNEVKIVKKNRINSILPYIPKEIRVLIEKIVYNDWLEIEEIRLRAGMPLTLEICGESCFLTPSGGISNHEIDAYRVSQEEVQNAFMAICENSIYAHMDEIRQGFITLKGGHRVGICGKAITEDEKIINFREISSLNYRIAHEILGISDSVINSVIQNLQVISTLVISPPQSGKTTLLRDLSRQISNRGFKTGIADDRGELAAMHGGLPQNDIGAQTDIIDGAPKSEAILMLLRTMSPKVIISDEIACEDDVKAIRLAHGTGASIIASTHGISVDDVKSRAVLRPIFEDNIFKQAIIIKRDFNNINSIGQTKIIKL